ncbi:MAG: ABC transporter ATP-binding protein [Porticoccaceae bacterium]
MTMTALLDVRHLTTRFHTRNGIITAVDDISFGVNRGETLALVGESGSGKSVACYSLLRLIPEPPGRIERGTALFAGTDLLQCDRTALRRIRGNDIAIVFQDPMSCLNPFMTIGEQLMEPLLYHRNLRRAEARESALAMLDEVGIQYPHARFASYPHEFSGGMRQRVMIAMALITEPQLLIADEPTTALDVTIQAQILELIRALQQRRNIGVILVSHDLAVVGGVADRIAVMHRGRIVETGATATVFRSPKDAYTRTLLAAITHGAKPTPATLASAPAPLVEVSGLTTRFRDYSAKLGTPKYRTAVDNVSLILAEGEILGLVGESGSGKSSLGRSILQLVRASTGSVKFAGQELTGLSAREMKPLRRRMQMIFQDPYASLNPRMSVFDTLAEPLLYHRLATYQTVTAQVHALLDEVGLARAYVRKYPHEFSGGQRQRIAIGRALATQPELVVADEPVSALDVTIQAQILELLLELVTRHGLTMLFISHDLAVVRYLTDRVAVMHQGRIIETGATEALWMNPVEPYTRDLLAAIPTGIRQSAPVAEN